MLESYEFEYDLAAHRAYQMKKGLWQYDDEDAEEPEWYQLAMNQLNQARTRRDKLRIIEIEQRPHGEGSKEWTEFQTKHDRLRAELLLRCSKIAGYWMRTCGIGFEEKERARLHLKTKYQ